MTGKQSLWEKLSLSDRQLVDKERTRNLLLSLFKLAGQAALVVVVITAVGGWLSGYFGSHEYIKAVLWAGLICFVSVVVGLVPVTAAVSKRAHWLAQACLGGAVARMLLTLSLAALVYFVLKLPLVVFALWIVAFYLVLLVWETRIFLRFIRAFYDSGSITSGAEDSQKGTSDRLKGLDSPKNR